VPIKAHGFLIGQYRKKCPSVSGLDLSQLQAICGKLWEVSKGGIDRHLEGSSPKKLVSGFSL
jgi:hypothetical protein